MEWKLIWSDTFDVDGPIDRTKWDIETGGNGFGNNEQQFYTDQLKNVRVENNRLVIEAHKEDYENRNYTSAKITTYSQKPIQYGKLSFRVKIPQGKGTWPAIWMLPYSIRENESWPGCGEIDILEHIGRKEDTVHFSLHTKLYNHNLKTQYTYFETIEGISDRFVDYTMIWDETSIELFIDSKSFTRFEKGMDGKDGSADGWPFDKPYYLILNLAIGGYWGGDIDETMFPVRMELEYIKLFAKETN